MNDTCGPTSGRQFAFYDPESQSLRTSQRTSFEDSQPFCGTVPRMGYLSAGWLWEHQRREPPTDETGSFLLLPTPIARDAKGIAFNPSDLSRLVNALVWLTGYRTSHGETTEQP